MSLRIWLPLTKDLRNQGLDDVTVTNNGATFSSVGKLGGCYSFGTGNSYIIIDSAPLKTFTEFSFACWVKIISWNTNYSTIFAAKNSTAVSWNNLIFSLLRDSSTSALCFNISNGSSYTATSCRTETLSLNTWYHIACTYKNGQIKLYQDGNVVSIYNTNVIPNFNSIVNLWIGKSNENSYQSNNLLNDVRIYDHALSPLEVKEISKGLALHYPLSDAYVEIGQNLCTVLTSNTGTQTWGDHSTIWTIEDATNFPIPINKCMKAVHTYTNTGVWGGYSRSIQTISALPSTIYTFSCYMKVSDNFDYTHSNFIYRYEYNSSGTKLIEGGLYNKTHMEFVGDGWYRCWGTFTTQATTASINISFYSYAEKNTTHWVGGWQIEQKDHMTPFMIPGTNRNNKIVYDCSGFCNNGIISGALSISSDTPKYEISTYMPATAIITHNRCLDNINQEWSCAAWVKPKVAGNYQNLNNFNNYNRLYHGTYPLLYVNDGANDYYNYGNLALPVNQWSHIVFVFKNSTGTKLIYINGENHTNMNGPNKTSTPKGIPDSVIIGNGNYEGGLCDYREYATALSADDVKSLYNNSAYIDNQGNIYGAVYEEV